MSEVYVPGVMYCAKCDLQLVRTNLHIQSGTTSAGDNKTEPCPNGCGPLWPVTWEKYAKEAAATTERQHDEIQQLKKEVAIYSSVIENILLNLQDIDSLTVGQMEYKLDVIKRKLIGCNEAVNNTRNRMTTI